MFVMLVVALILAGSSGDNFTDCGDDKIIRPETVTLHPASPHLSEGQGIINVSIGFNLKMTESFNKSIFFIPSTSYPSGLLYKDGIFGWINLCPYAHGICDTPLDVCAYDSSLCGHTETNGIYTAVVQYTLAQRAPAGQYRVTVHLTHGTTEWACVTIPFTAT